jgi:hypothetical protein
LQQRDLGIGIAFRSALWQSCIFVRSGGLAGEEALNQSAETHRQQAGPGPAQAHRYMIYAEA